MAVTDTKARSREVKKARARSRAKSRTDLDRLSALREITLAVTSTSNLESVLNLLLEKITTLLPYTVTHITLYNPSKGRLEPLAFYNFDGGEWIKSFRKGGRGFTKVVFESQTPVVVRNIQTDPRTRDPEFARKHGLVSYAGIPLIVKEKPLGVLGFHTKREQTFSKKEIEFLTTLGGHAAIAIHNSQIFEQLKERSSQLEDMNRQLGALLAITQLTNESLDIKVVVQRVMAKVLEVFRFDAARVYLLDEEKRVVRLSSRTGFPKGMVIPTKYQPGEGMMGQVFASGEPLYFADLQTDPEYRRLARKGYIQKAGYRSSFLIPIGVKGECVGVMNFLSKQRHLFTPDEQQLAKSIADHLGVAVENFQLYQRTKQQANALQKEFVERTRTAMELESSRIANRHKSEFLGNVSHELRTPLNSIIGFTRLVLNKTNGQIPALQSENLKDALTSAEHLHELVNELLDLSRIETGRAELSVAPIEIRAAIDDAVSVVQPLIKAKCKLVNKVPTGAPLIRTDLQKLRQVLVNVLSNAAKFTEKGRITVSLQRQKKNIKIAICDTGRGIPRDEINRIFEEFYQAQWNEIPNYEGSGLGLAISKKLMNLLGGNITVESELGKGSTFTLTIPTSIAD